MAPHRRRAADTASVGLYLQATLLACLLFAAVTRAASSSQTDEDLIFEEEGIMRTRRDIEVAPVEAPLPEEQPSFLTRVRRQFSFLGFGSNAPTDDEDEIGSAGEEGSGGEQLRIYRAKVHVVKDWRPSLGNMNSPDFVALARDLERNLEVALRRISGDKTVKVSSMRRSDPGKILATVDINYMGWSDETEAMRRAIRSVLDSQYLGTIPVNSQFFSFEEPKAARPSCPAGQHRCPSGRCVKRCDGRAECLDGSDELNCVVEVDVVPTSGITSGSAAPTCRSDDQGPNVCRDGRTFACFCDGKVECPDGGDEDDCPYTGCETNELSCDDGTSCIQESKQCDGVEDCFDGTDEKNCPSVVPCGRNQYQCKTGECIDDFRHCDYMKDCPGGEDEEFCPGEWCPEGKYMCKNGDCIDIAYRCDGLTQCQDQSDEIDCPCNPATLWQCNDGICIDRVFRCDGKQDCPNDNSDEYLCTSDCRHDQFRCEDNSCIELSQRCNGRAECLNGEDERGCPCSPDEFRCQRDGQCIDSRKQCDGRNDCSDGSDELNCRCPAGEWRCLNGQCIPSAYRCDGRQDCSDRSDETVECPPPPPRPPAQPCDVDQFECRNGRCISRAFLCDGIPDCTDGSDEINENCRNKSEIRCRSDQFSCSSGECVGLNKRCNGHFDCVDASDETGCPKVERECTGNEFRCTDGVCISSDWKCDNVPDCSDGSDETGCVTPCKQTEYQCGDGTCIPESERCDGIFDCADQSDERDNCCHSDEFQCRNGDCIPSSQRCNGYPECVDHSDEHECIDQCTSSEFTCGSGECISSNVVCDGRFDCTDGSDERENCVTADPVVTPRQESCTVDQFKCRNGFCIDQYQLCDGRQDCSDGSDEDNCGPRCQPYEFQCRGGRCISRNARCDGRRDCLDGSDEIDCLITTPYTPFTPPTPTPSAASGPPPPRNYFICKDGGFIENFRRCDGRRDCNDGSDEDERCKSQTDTIDLKTYPDEQTIQQSKSYLVTDPYFPTTPSSPKPSPTSEAPTIISMSPFRLPLTIFLVTFQFVVFMLFSY